MEAEPGAGGPGSPGPDGPVPATGDARVDEAVGLLGDLANLPVAGHPGVFERVHQRLAEALGDLDGRGGTGPGEQPGPPAR